MTVSLAVGMAVLYRDRRHRMGRKEYTSAECSLGLFHLCRLSRVGKLVYNHPKDFCTRWGCQMTRWRADPSGYRPVVPLLCMSTCLDNQGGSSASAGRPTRHLWTFRDAVFHGCCSDPRLVEARSSRGYQFTRSLVTVTKNRRAPPRFMYSHEYTSRYSTSISTLSTTSFTGGPVESGDLEPRSSASQQPPHPPQCCTVALVPT